MRRLEICALLLFVRAILCCTQLCDRTAVVTEGNYTFNNNIWNDDGTGIACTYVSGDPSNSFFSEWTWPSSPPVVHAYPHVQYETRRLPVVISELSRLEVNLQWAIRPSSLDDASASDDPNTEPNADALEAIDVESSVAIDLFADVDAATSKKPAKQGFEIMIWLARFGIASEPLGLSRPNQLLLKETVGGTEFTLYNGTNGSGQTVYSWVPSAKITSLDADIAPFVHSLARYNLIPWTAYLGVVQFGTETFFSTENVTFTVKNFAAALSLTSEDNSTIDTSTSELPNGGASSRASLMFGIGLWCWLWTWEAVLTAIML